LFANAVFKGFCLGIYYLYDYNYKYVLKIGMREETAMCIYCIFNAEGSEEAIEKLNGLVAKYKKADSKLCE